MVRRTPLAALALSIAIVTFGGLGDARAASVFLNGVNIDGVANKVFFGAKVQIDESGNVYITTSDRAGTKGSSEVPSDAAAVEAKVEEGKTPTRRYWLVTEKAAPGMAQYDIDLFVNSKWVRRFLDREDHVVMEITKHFVTGQNTVHLVAKKNLGNARRSQSPHHYFRVVIGEGNKGGRNVMINRKLIDYKRTALETKDFKDQYKVQVQ